MGSSVERTWYATPLTKNFTLNIRFSDIERQRGETYSIITLPEETPTNAYRRTGDTGAHVQQIYDGLAKPKLIDQSD